MGRMNGLGRVVALVALAAASVPRSASGQDLSWALAAEAAGDDVYVLYGQPSLSFGPEVGWSPDIGISAYHVWTSGADGWGITPQVGLKYRTDGGFIGGSVGWAIRDDVEGIDVFGGSDNGLHTSLHTEYWGSGTWGLQGIASYNWGSDNLWSRARVTRRVNSLQSPRAIALGAELVWQVADGGEGEDDNHYEATYIGPVLQLIQPGGVTWALSGGLKSTQPGDNDTWYAKVELYLP